MKSILSFACRTFPSLVIACSAGAAPVSNSPHDPSSPLAPEAAAPTVGASSPGPSEPAPAPAADPHAQHHHGAPAGGETASKAGPSKGATEPVYTCPMHPEVVSKTPGVCPKCNMNLVLKK